MVYKFPLSFLFDKDIVITEIEDVRVADWPLMGSCWPTLGITAAYLLLVHIGLILMQKRPPLQLRPVLFCYNTAMIVLNWHILSRLFAASWRLRYNYLCQPVNRDPSNEAELEIAAGIWWYYISKMVEFLDTIFFVLRKKSDQITFLHLYHHATMFPIWYLGTILFAGGTVVFGVMLNSLVHVIMYSYYGLSVLGPSFSYLTMWKKYLTTLQLVQFFIGVIFGLQLLLTECPHLPRWAIICGIAYGSSMIALFGNFYHRAYRLRARMPRQQTSVRPSPKVSAIIAAKRTKCVS